MINAEKLLDALEFLPDELLEETDALRRKNRVRWQPLVALAACLCLAAGLWMVPNIWQVTSDNASAESTVGDAHYPFDGHQQESTTTNDLTATILEVNTDWLTVILDSGSTVEVSLTNLEEIPAFSTGQSIRIYCEEATGTTTLSPYKIEIVEEP